MCISKILAVAVAVPWAAFADVCLQNAAFDVFGDGGKPEAWSLSGKFRIARGDGHNGSSGLCWESAEPCGKLHTARQRLQGVKPGDLLVFEMLVKKEGFKTAGSQGAVFSIEMRDENDKWIRALYATTKSVKTDGEWTRVRSSGMVPLNTRNAVVVIYVSGDSQGRVCWDNIVVGKVTADPVEFVCTSAYRGLAEAGKVDFHAALHVPEKQDASRLEAFFRWKGADGNPVRRPAGRFLPDEASISLDVAELAFGRQDVTCELLADGKVIGSASTPFTRVTALPRRNVWIDRHGRCIVNGEPFFPLGMYWNPNERQMAAYTNGPFNCVVHYEMMTPKKLDFCRAHGLMSLSAIDRKLWKAACDTTKPDVGAAKERLVQAMAAIKDHPAFLGWYVGDEVEIGSVQSQVKLNAFIAEQDPGHPTYAVQDRTYDLRRFLPTADVIGLDPYPVAHKPVRMVTDFMREGRKALFGARPFWSVPQAFSWQWYRAEAKDTERCPTLAEMRSMNWQHIANGANGLFSFAYHCYFYPLNKQDWRPLWAAAVEANREVAKMIPVLLSVDPAPSAKGDSEELVCRTWMKGGDLYLLACNISDKPLYAAAELSAGRWRMAGAEVGSPATMDGERKVRFYLDPIGVSFVRLSPEPSR